MPSEGDLTNIWGVSRTVVRKALDVLEADGQLVRQKGRRARVAPLKYVYQASASPPDRLGVHDEDDLRLREVLDTRWVVAGATVGRALRVASTQVVLQLTYIQDSRGTPLSLNQSYLRMDATPRLKSVVGGPASAFVLGDGGPEITTQLRERYGLSLAMSEVVIEGTKANEFEAQVLRLPSGLPMFLITAVDFARSHAPVRFTRTVIPADRARFAMAIRRQPRATESLPAK